MIISLNRGKREDAESANEDGRLREILSGYPALDAAMNDQKTECHAADGPSQSKVSLQQNDRIAETFLFDLMCLHTRESMRATPDSAGIQMLKSILSE